jgi:biopolymer transport protein ExbD
MSVEFNRPSTSSGAMNLTPLIDVIFQLLIFFMLTSSFIYPALDMKLPRADSEKITSQAQQLVISVDTENRIYVNREEVPETHLEAVLSEKIASLPSRAVFFRADRGLTYERFTEIMQVATRAGARSFNLIHEPKK